MHGRFSSSPTTPARSTISCAALFHINIGVLTETNRNQRGSALNTVAVLIVLAEVVAGANATRKVLNAQSLAFFQGDET